MKFIGITRAICTLILKIVEGPPKGPFRCTGVCGLDLPRDYFINDKSRPDGRYPWCRECSAAYQRERWKSLPACKRPKGKRYHLYPEAYRKRERILHRDAIVRKRIKAGKSLFSGLDKPEKHE